LRKSLLYVIILLFTVLVGCGSDKQIKGQSLSFFPDKVEVVEVAHLQGTLEKEWTISGDQLEKLRGWFDDLLLKEKETQNPLTDITGIEKYTFDFGKKYTKIIYLIGDGKEYLQVGDKEWYEIKNPSIPPVDK